MGSGQAVSIDIAENLQRLTSMNKKHWWDLISNTYDTLRFNSLLFIRKMSSLIPVHAVGRFDCWGLGESRDEYLHFFLPIIYPWTFIFCVVLALGGCGGLLAVADSEPTQTYRLEANFASGQLVRDAKVAPTVVIMVATPAAQAGFDTTGIAYVRKAYRLDYYSKNQWVDSPQRMLLPLLVLTLEGNGQFRAVLPVSSSVTGDVRLETEILCLQHEMLTLPSQFRVTLRAQLLDLHHHQILATHTFDAVELSPSEDPYGGVVAANRAIGRLLQEVAAFVATEASNLAGEEGGHSPHTTR
ncbi:cholesterol transport system auxiliary component [Gammaproteobacteria bacterium]